MDGAAAAKLWAHAIDKEERARAAHIIASKKVAVESLSPRRHWDVNSVGETLGGNQWVSRTRKDGKKVHCLMGLDKTGKRCHRALDEVFEETDIDSSLDVPAPSTVDWGVGATWGTLPGGAVDDFEFEPARSSLSKSSSCIAIPQSREAKVQALLAHPRTRRIGERLQQHYMVHRSTPAPMAARSNTSRRFAKLHQPMATTISRPIRTREGNRSIQPGGVLGLLS